MDKVLSIVVPAYNMEQYLRHTLETCLVQDQVARDLYEVIVVNDGSKDATQIIAEEYGRKYSNIFKVINKENGGYGSAINVGINVAKGKYFKVLDADDWYDTDELKKFINKLKLTDCDLIFTDYISINDKTGEKELHSYPFEKDTIFTLEEVNVQPKFLAMHGMCFKTAILKQNNIRITEHCFYTDTEYVLYPLPYVESTIYYPICLYQYRVEREGQSVSLEGITKHLGDLERVIEEITEHFKDGIKKNQKLIESKIAGTYSYYVDCLLLLPCNDNNKNKIKDSIAEIQNGYPNGFYYCENKKIRLLRKSRYILYRPCCIWRRKIEWKKRKY